jgi:hypothetical protein
MTGVDCERQAKESSVRQPLLATAALLFSTVFSGDASAQGPRRLSPTGFSRASLQKAVKSDSVPSTQGLLALAPAAQDSTRTCRSTMPWVLFGGFVGYIVGSARYEKGLEQSGEDFAPWLSIPFTVGPYILGGMLLGHLIAPC